MKNFNFFVLIVLGIYGCAEDDIEFVPGPIISDVIKNRESDKNRALKVEEKASELDQRTKGIQEEVQPLVEEKDRQLSLQRSLDQLIESAGDLSSFQSDPLRQPLEILTTEIEIQGSDLKQEVILVRGPHINFENLESTLATSSLITDATPEDPSKMTLQVPSDKALPILFSCVLFELEESEVLETMGLDLFVQAEKIRIHGLISTKPSQADPERQGLPGGNLGFDSIVFESAASARIILSGGDAGHFDTDVPLATKDQLKAARASALALGFSTREIEAQKVSASPDLLEELKDVWPEMKTKVLRETQLKDSQIPTPWHGDAQIQSRDASNRRANWSFQVHRSGELAVPLDRFPLVEIPEIEFTQNSPGGEAGTLSFSSLAGSFEGLDIQQSSGADSQLLNKRRFEFRIPENEKWAELRQELTYLISWSLDFPVFAEEHSRGRDGDYHSTSAYSHHESLYSDVTSISLIEKKRIYFDTKPQDQAPEPRNLELEAPRDRVNWENLALQFWGKEAFESGNSSEKAWKRASRDSLSN